LGRWSLGFVRAGLGRGFVRAGQVWVGGVWDLLGLAWVGGV
jgi:hypothetical protein